MIGGRPERFPVLCLRRQSFRSAADKASLCSHMSADGSRPDFRPPPVHYFRPPKRSEKSRTTSSPEQTSAARRMTDGESPSSVWAGVARTSTAADARLPFLMKFDRVRCGLVRVVSDAKLVRFVCNRNLDFGHVPPVGDNVRALVSPGDRRQENSLRQRYQLIAATCQVSVHTVRNALSVAS